MPFHERPGVRVHFRDAGSGFPLLILPGGGLNATISFLEKGAPFNPIEEFGGTHRCIALDLRNAAGGQSSGPLEPERPWDMHADDQLAVLDHLGIDRFAVMGFCIGGPFAWNLLQRAPGRVAAAVMVQPSGFRPEMPTLSYDTNMAGWGPALCARRPDIGMDLVQAYLTAMYRNNPDFVYTVTRDFVRSCRTPVLVLPDDIPAHPYAVAMEAVRLAPNAEAGAYPWKTTDETLREAVAHVRRFLRAHTPPGGTQAAGEG